MFVNTVTIFISYCFRKEFVAKLNLKAGEAVLDVGSGTGGGAFYMAEVNQFVYNSPSRG